MESGGGGVPRHKYRDTVTIAIGEVVYEGREMSLDGGGDGRTHRWDPFRYETRNAGNDPSLTCSAAGR